jgi:hypothetical protein
MQPAAHLGQAVVLEQPDRLAEDRPADSAFFKGRLSLLAAATTGEGPAGSFNKGRAIL